MLTSLVAFRVLKGVGAPSPWSPRHTSPHTIPLVTFLPSRSHAASLPQSLLANPSRIHSTAAIPQPHCPCKRGYYLSRAAPFFPISRFFRDREIGNLP